MEPLGRTLSDAERHDWLRLIRSENVGPRTFFMLLARLGTAAAAFDAAPELSRRGGRKRGIRIAAIDAVDAEIEATAAVGARLIALGEPDYPAPLAAIPDPPPLIAVLGDPAMLGRSTIAVVGARNASAAGRRFAREIAAGLGSADIVVASGMARGIDAAAHEGALASGTVAVLAGGVDVPYPAENAELYGQIIAAGAVLSEQPVGIQPIARHFPPRNRLISGLSLGILVVEAAPRSGSLITARMALEQGREVFAVPGSPLDPRARGANHLIRQGATLTESAADIVDALEGSFHRALAAPVQPFLAAGNDAPPAEPEVAEARGEVAEKLGATPVTVDELVRECQFSPAIVLGALLELELAGRIERHPGNRISRIL